MITLAMDFDGGRLKKGVRYVNVYTGEKFRLISAGEMNLTGEDGSVLNLYRSGDEWCGALDSRAAPDPGMKPESYVRLMG